MSDFRPYDPVEGPAREPLDLATEIGDPDYTDPRLISEDFRRRRAKFFDGRFLTARDLTREQQYGLIRQADLGQAGGGGIASGLQVHSFRRDARQLTIRSGSGVTPAGEVLRLKKAVRINVRNLPNVEQLEATNGLAPLPGVPIARATGLFVLGLRAVEFTDNPTVAYPVGLDDGRRLARGEVVDATALIMVPFQSTGNDGIQNESRADLAREVFLDRGLSRLSSEVLPLAVVALDRGNIVWIDRWMVRRMVGSDEVLSFGLGERSVREAFHRQYRQHLFDTESQRYRQGNRKPLTAREFFTTLPPFGPLPRNSVEVRDDQVVESFFPAEMPIELTIIPRDELAALAEESLHYAPFDLNESDESMELTPVMLCIPLGPEDHAEMLAELRTERTSQARQRINRPTTRVLPIQALDVLRKRRAVLAPVPTVAVDLAPWQKAIKMAGRLYYVRRRQLSQVAYVVPRFQPLLDSSPLTGGEWTVPLARLATAGEGSGGLLRRLDFLVRRASTEVLDAFATFLSISLFDNSVTPFPASLFINGAIAELAYRVRIRLEDIVRGEVFPERTLSGEAPPLLGHHANVRVRPLRVDDITAMHALYEAVPLPGAGLAELISRGNALTPDPIDFTDDDIRPLLATSLRLRELNSVAFGLIGNNAALDALAARLAEFVRSANLAGIRDLAAGIPPAQAGSSIGGTP